MNILSDEPAFILAQRAEKPRLDPYLRQHGYAGRQETFAESVDRRCSKEHPLAVVLSTDDDDDLSIKLPDEEE